MTGQIIVKPNHIQRPNLKSWLVCRLDENNVRGWINVRAQDTSMNCRALERCLVNNLSQGNAAMEANNGSILLWNNTSKK